MKLKNKILITLFVIFAQTTFGQSASQCWFSHLTEQLNSKNVTASFEKFVGENPNSLTTYNAIYEAKGTQHLTNAPALESFSKIVPDLIAKIPVKNKRGAVFDKLATFSANAIESFTTNLPKGHNIKGPELSTRLDQLSPEILNVWELIYKQGKNADPRKRFDFDFLASNTSAKSYDDIKNYAKTTSTILEKISEQFTQVRSLVKNRGQARANFIAYLENNTAYATAYEQALKIGGFPARGNKTWQAYFNALKQAGYNTFELHHILSVNLLELQPLQLYFEYYTGVNKINFNGLGDARNGLMLEKFSSGKGVHANHPDYEAAINAWITNKWFEITEQAKKLRDSQQKQLEMLHEELETLTNGIQKALTNKSIKGQPKGKVKVNELFGVKETDDSDTKIYAVQAILDEKY